ASFFALARNCRHPRGHATGGGIGIVRITECSIARFLAGYVIKTLECNRPMLGGRLQPGFVGSKVAEGAAEGCAEPLRNPAAGFGLPRDFPTVMSPHGLKRFAAKRFGFREIGKRRLDRSAVSRLNFGYTRKGTERLVHPGNH